MLYDYHHVLKRIKVYEREQSGGCRGQRDRQGWPQTGRVVWGDGTVLYAE